jgi:hypothetical protein
VPRFAHESLAFFCEKSAIPDFPPSKGDASYVCQYAIKFRKFKQGPSIVCEFLGSDLFGFSSIVAFAIKFQRFGMELESAYKHLINFMNTGLLKVRFVLGISFRVIPGT